ncbi:hypothetical protein QCE64_04910 [Caballeronia sp. LZ043]|nr:hypothetical protein [Caballeronia sp. LZ043]
MIRTIKYREKGINKMKHRALTVCLLFSFSVQLHAQSTPPIRELEAQKTKIEREIDTRNALLDTLKIREPMLASVNTHELTVEYLLDTMSTLFELAGKVSGSDEELKQDKIKRAAQSLGNACTEQKIEMLVTQEQIQNSEMRREVGKQVDNVREACSLLYKHNS